MSRCVLYRHGPLAGQVVCVDDDVYAESLLATGYAVDAPADEVVVVAPEPEVVEPTEPAEPGPPADPDV